MIVEQILLISAVIIFSRLVFSKEIYRWFLFGFSLLAIYWFQPLSPIRTLEFWMPTIVLVITILAWSFINHANDITQKENYLSLLIIVVFLIVQVLTRIFGWNLLNPIVSMQGLRTIIVALFLIILAYLSGLNRGALHKATLFVIFIFIIGGLVILKSEPLSLLTSSFLRRINSQLTSLASASDLTWIGFSYFSFRILHILFERERVKKMNLSLREFLTYLVFLPAYVSGPIDRVDLFIGQLRSDISTFSKDDFLEGLFRIVKGILFKFIIADNLALISLDSPSNLQLTSQVWSWIIVYCYAFRIFFDFAGYTDIAIGIGRLAGLKLPENFKQPYLSRNITIFWNNWHITLTQWFRTYYFNPLTRYLRTYHKELSQGVVIFITQISTMILISLWHGISWNFIFWGLWIGIGLFIHNRFSTLVLAKNNILKKFLDSRAGYGVSVIINFNYIALGWIWFASSSLDQSLSIFKKLLGF